MTVMMEDVVISRMEAGSSIGGSRIERVWLNSGNVKWIYTQPSSGDWSANAIILAGGAAPIVSGGSTLNSTISGTGSLAAPFVPGGSILSAAATSVKATK
jgi:hypothetical protein